MVLSCARNLQSCMVKTYLGILEADTIKQAEIKENIKKEYLSKTRKQSKTKLYRRNRTKGLSTGAIPQLRYFGSFFLIVAMPLFSN